MCSMKCCHSSLYSVYSIAHRAAGLFCKLSGLLTSYGLYQVVLHEQLALYCKGSKTSFSARLVLIDLATSTGEGQSVLCVDVVHRSMHEHSTCTTVACLTLQSIKPQTKIRGEVLSFESEVFLIP